MALISGWDDWKNCTNHGLRALGVTTLVSSKENNLTNKAVLNHTRHANAKSQKPYLRETVTNKSTLQYPLIGKLNLSNILIFVISRGNSMILKINMKRSVRKKVMVQHYVDNFTNNIYLIYDYIRIFLIFS